MKLDENEKVKCITIANLLVSAFCWKDSKEGRDYWQEVHDKLLKMGKDRKWQE